MSTKPTDYSKLTGQHLSETLKDRENRWRSQSDPYYHQPLPFVRSSSAATRTNADRSGQYVHLKVGDKVTFTADYLSQSGGHAPGSGRVTKVTDGIVSVTMRDGRKLRVSHANLRKVTHKSKLRSR